MNGIDYGTILSRLRPYRLAIAVLAAALAALSAAVPACRTQAPPRKTAADRPRVAEFKPGEVLERENTALHLVFDRIMVGVDQVGPALARPPVRIEPEQPVEAHWDDRKTLVVRPRDSWKAGERYRISLDTGLLGPLEKPSGFTFDVTPLRLRWLTLPDRNASRKPEFDAYFTLEVDPRRAASACGLVDPTGKRYPLELAWPEEEQIPEAGVTSVPFTVSETLEMETHYRLDCRDLLPARGGAPWREKPKPETYQTHGLLRVIDAFPKPGATPPPERASLCFNLSTPVDPDQLKRHVRVTPKPEGLEKRWHHGSCDDDYRDTDRGNSVLLPPRTDFKVEIDAGLTDVFGQKLGKGYSYSFRTGDRIPGLWTATGTARVLEYGRQGHAVGTLNLQSAKLSCARLTPAQLAAGFEDFTRWVFYRPDEHAGLSDPLIDLPRPPWALLDLPPREHLLDAKQRPNTARTVPLDLGERCGPESGAPGIYAMQIEPLGETGPVANRQGDDPARLLANVTDLGVVAKRGEQGALVWVTRLSSGALVRGARVRVLDHQGELISQGRTDSRGLARFSGLGRTDEQSWFAVVQGADTAIVSTDWRWREGLSPWQLDVRASYGDEGLRLFVHTDRGVYRPGERVLLHGLARRISDTAPAKVPRNRQVVLDLSAEGESVFHQELRLSDFGSFHTEIDLPPHLKPGVHRLLVRAAGKKDIHQVRVAEFRPVTFELLGGPKANEVLAPEKASVQLEARYLFGAPVPEAEVRWTVEMAPGRVRAPDFADYSFEDSSPALPDEEPWPEPSRGIVQRREVKTDAQGRTGLSVDTRATRGPTRYQFTAEVTDAGKDRTSRSLSVLAHSAERYIGVRFHRGLFDGNQPVSAELVIVNRDGAPVSGSAEVELRHVRWDCSHPRQQCRASVQVLERHSVSVTASRPALVTFQPSPGGTVHVRALTRDNQARVARASDSAWVWSLAGELVGPYSDRVAATLSVDRRAYRVGQRAGLALQTPLNPGFFLLTAERADVLYARVVKGSGGTPSIPLAASAAPNAFLTMTGTVPRTLPGERGRPRLVAGAREVEVRGPSRLLRADISLQRDTYQPREQVQGEVRVTHRGRPAVAEVALVAVNESVLQLTGFKTPDPSLVFHKPRGLGVTTVSNITKVIADLVEAARVPEVARLEEDGTDGGKGRPELRDDYLAAAYWAPALRTDASGRVRFAFDAPSDLSAYRLMAVVAAKDDRVGSADARVTVRQPLSARPLVPRFVSRDDELQLGALVHDQTEAEGPVALDFAASGLQLESKQAELAGGESGERVAHTRARVGDVDQAWFEVEVHKASHADRVRRSFKVRRPLDTELRVLANKRDSEIRARLEWPAGIDPELSRLEITVDRAGLAPLAPVLAAVVNYPYGCTEQTAAALSALSATPELAAAIDPELVNREKLEVKIRDGLSRLARARTRSGHYAVFAGMRGNPWMTALVLEAALSARDAGFRVPEGIVVNAIEVLSRWIKQRKIQNLSRRRGDLQLAVQTAWLLSRSGKPLESAEQELWAMRKNLGAYEKAYLLQTWAQRNAHPDRRSALRRWLVRISASLDRGAPRDPETPFLSAERTRALILRALLADNSEPEQQARLAKRLIERASDPGGWLSTRETAETLAALSGWARQRQAGASRVKVGLGTTVLLQGALEGAQVAAVNRAAAQSPSGEVWVEADGKVTVSIRRRDVSSSAPKPAFSRGLSLARRYLHPETGKPIQTLSAGEIVQVELLLKTDHALRMVALSDPMPAGLEPLDPGLSTGRYAGCTSCDRRADFDHVVRRDDRVEAFAEFLPAGTHELRYLLRARIAGRYCAPGATALPMYLPDLLARSAVGRIAVE